jgi:hypothetical protein
MHKIDTPLPYFVLSLPLPLLFAFATAAPFKMSCSDPRSPMVLF